MKRAFVPLILVVLLVGCAGLQAEKQELAVSISFNQMLKEYKIRKGDLTIEQQSAVDEWIVKAADALDYWELALETGGDPGTSKEDFLEYKSKIIREIGEEMGWIQPQ